MDGINLNVQSYQSVSDQSSFNINQANEPKQEDVQMFEDLLEFGTKTNACSLTDHNCGGAANSTQWSD